MSKCNHDFVHRVPNCIAPSIAPHWACNVCKQQFVLPSHGADAEARAVMWKDAYDRESTANAALREQLEELHGALNRSEMRCRKIGSENSKMVEREITLQNQLSELQATQPVVSVIKGQQIPQTVENLQAIMERDAVALEKAHKENGKLRQTINDLRQKIAAREFQQAGYLKGEGK